MRTNCENNRNTFHSKYLFNCLDDSYSGTKHWTITTVAVPGTVRENVGLMRSHLKIINEMSHAGMLLFC